MPAPPRRFTAAFMGESTALEATVIAAPGGAVLASTGLGDFPLPVEAPIGIRPLVASRPEHLHLGEPRQTLHLGDGEITDVIFQGSFRRVAALSAARPDDCFEAKVPCVRRLPSASASPYPAIRDLIVTTR